MTTQNQNPKSDSHVSLFVIDRRDFDPKNYWYIHGKYYNLTNYMEKHPGGKFILEKTKGQGDLSALYESYHAFSNIDNIDKYLKTFEVKFNKPFTTPQNQHEYKTDNYNIIYVPKNNIYDAYLNIAESFETQKDQDTDSEKEQDIIPETETQQQTEEIQNESQFDFTNYRFLTTQVKQLFPTREDIKAPYEWYTLIIAMFFTFFYGFYNGLFSSPQTLLQKLAFLPLLSDNVKIALLRVFFITLSSASWMGLGFNVMHDSSHYAITINPNINYYATKTWNALNGWNALLWFYHHVQNHHSYTGIETQDPDYDLYQNFVNNSYDKSHFINSYLKQMQPYIFPFYFILFPGQNIGQGIKYLISSFQRKISHTQLPDAQHTPEFYDTYDISFFFLALLAYENVILLGNGYWLLLYFTQLNFFYMFNVIFDHDLFENTIENKYHGKDWVKLQISHSGNFCNGNRFWTKWFGGINYQIEHHLFPSMCNIHYPTITPLVQEYCQINRIPYVHQPTFKEAIQSFLKTLYWHSITQEQKRD
jgi:linoleoyl-CoA desaturase